LRGRGLLKGKNPLTQDGKEGPQIWSKKIRVEVEAQDNKEAQKRKKSEKGTTVEKEFLFGEEEQKMVEASKNQESNLRGARQRGKKKNVLGEKEGQGAGPAVAPSNEGTGKTMQQM